VLSPGAVRARPVIKSRNIQVLTKATDVTPDHGYLVYSRHAEHPRNGCAVVLPNAQVVTEPFAYLVSSSCKRRSGDDKCAETRTTGEHRLMSRNRHHSAVQVVCREVLLKQPRTLNRQRLTRIVLNEPICVDRIRLVQY